MEVNEHFVLREIYDTAILMPIRINDASNDPIFLNPVGAIIWKSIREEKSKEDLVHDVAKSFGLEQESAEATAVESFVKQLIEMHLIFE